MAGLSKEVWCMAALHAVGDAGISKLSVERLARELGVTKGSFYWHFKNRDALVAAMLELWQTQGTEQVILDLERRADPREKLAGLFRRSLEDLDLLRIEATLAGAASEGHPLVGPVFDTVSCKRLGYLEQLYREIGVQEPAIWARGAFASYLGGVQLSAMTPSRIAPDDVEPLVRLLCDRWVPEAASAPSVDIGRRATG